MSEGLTGDNKKGACFLGADEWFFEKLRSGRIVLILVLENREKIEDENEDEGFNASRTSIRKFHPKPAAFARRGFHTGFRCHPFCAFFDNCQTDAGAWEVFLRL